MVGYCRAQKVAVVYCRYGRIRGHGRVRKDTVGYGEYLRVR